MEWSGEGYAAISGLQKWLADESLAQLQWRHRDEVLDLGCGDGKITAQIAPLVARALGVDFSQSMVDFARAHHRLENLSYVQGDARTFRCDSTFDRIVSFNALHWIPEAEQPQVFATLAAGLKPKGQAHVRLVGEGPQKSLEDVLEDVRRLPRWSEFFAGYSQPFCHPTLEQVREWAAQAGLKLVEHRLEQKYWDFGSRAAFEHWGNTTMVNWYAQVPAERREEFVRDVIDHYFSPQVFTFYQLVFELRPGN
ncbi:MAG: class I SAM-dependent methyltransferase [Candidatus Eremiobacteraeota bacterium]|nr:class I SAM-dependent methyltransferase [Candidatus Eremiobacteraeota bacterium]MCW5867705.1 class I SAM-dependent methyltransferase [Candidatus Eremiobacteraeota bacterium]